MEIGKGSARVSWYETQHLIGQCFSSTTHAVDGLIDTNPNQIPVREIEEEEEGSAQHVSHGMGRSF